MELVYHCKKNGRDYVYKSGAELTAPQDIYSWRKGVNEYADNYHASLTRKGQNAFAGSDEEFATKITELCEEAHARWHTGDVPGNRAPTDPKVTAARKLATEILAAGGVEQWMQLNAATTLIPAKKKSAA
jgi:hypothetical protein